MNTPCLPVNNICRFECFRYTQQQQAAAHEPRTRRIEISRRRRPREVRGSTLDRNPLSPALVFCSRDVWEGRALVAGVKQHDRWIIHRQQEHLVIASPPLHLPMTGEADPWQLLEVDRDLHGRSVYLDCTFFHPLGNFDPRVLLLLG